MAPASVARSTPAIALTAVACLPGLLVLAGSASARRGQTLLVNQANGVAGDDNADSPSISANGRFVAFESGAENLGSGDISFKDVFVRDLEANTTTLVSQSSTGVNANGDSQHAAISADGRFVAFESDADNLSPGDDDSVSNVFVRDRQANTTTLVSQAGLGVGADGPSRRPAISADGRSVAFTSFAGNLSVFEDDDFLNVYVRDLHANTTTLASQTGGVGANGHSNDPSISGDGRVVAFTSIADNLTGDDGAFGDVFVRDLTVNTTSLVSLANGVGANAGSRDPSISDDGRRVAFVSDADNLSGEDDNDVTNLFVRDLRAATTTLASHNGGRPADDDSEEISMSGDGRFLAFESTADDLSTIDDDAFINVFRQDLRGPAPVCSGVARTVAEDGAATVTLPCRDDDGDPITRAIVSGPAHGSLGPVDQAAGTVGYTPDPGYTGPDAFSFRGSDASGGSAPARARLTVTATPVAAFGPDTLVTLALARARVPARGPVRVRVRNANAFPVSGRLSARRVGTRRARLKAKRVAVAEAATRTVGLRLPKRLRRALRRRQTLALRVTATLRDPAGNTRTVRKTLRPRLRQATQRPR